MTDTSIAKMVLEAYEDGRQSGILEGKSQALLTVATALLGEARRATNAIRCSSDGYVIGFYRGARAGYSSFATIFRGYARDLDKQRKRIACGKVGA